MKKELTEEQKEKNRIRSKEWRKKNKDKIKEYQKNDNFKEYQKNYKKNYNNKELRKEYQKNYQKNYRDKNKDKAKQNQENYKKYDYKKKYDYNKEKNKEYRLRYLTLEKKEELKLKKRIRQKELRENNPLFRLKGNISSLVRQSLKLKGYQKESRTHEILGCSFEELKQHLESQFENWMNWANYGNPEDGLVEPNKTWDIDHIKPLASATNEEELLKLNHYTNLQPLCSYHNRFIKKDKYITN